MKKSLGAIVIACDSTENEAFAFWLRKQGYDASVGSDTGNHYPDTMTQDEFNGLWDDYCRS